MLFHIRRSIHFFLVGPKDCRHTSSPCRKRQDCFCHTVLTGQGWGVHLYRASPTTINREMALALSLLFTARIDKTASGS
jgi:hypothetical protein